jgi:hypothetical protein
MDTLEPLVMSDTSDEEPENVIEKPKRMRKPLSDEQKQALVKRLAEGRAKKAKAKAPEPEPETEPETEPEPETKPKKIARAKPVKEVNADYYYYK